MGAVARMQCSKARSRALKPVASAENVRNEYVMSLEEGSKMQQSYW